MNGFREEREIVVYLLIARRLGPRFGIAETLASVASINLGLPVAESERRDLDSVESLRVKRQHYNLVGECTGVRAEQTWVLMPNLLLMRPGKVSYLKAVSLSFLICEMKIV